MSNFAIRVQALSKRYEIGVAKRRHDTLRDQLTAGFKTLFHLNGRSPAHRSEETFWALKDVSFEVKKGDVVGIIGKNGAGKSTLLKILSRITEPTEGRAEIHGRVGSLLEVGTGFHPELTGRENIFLNGAILGMTKAEIERKFNEIVAFADIAKFIETPVKRYSSGMYVRLAFAVAAHLEPEVLIVDEVLAVGDVAFQTKCLGKMGEVAGQGRTVLFVSHNMAAVQHLCKKVFLLDGGTIAFAGTSQEAVDFYMNGLSHRSASTSRSHIVDLSEAAGRPPAYGQMLTSLELYDEQGNPFSGRLRIGAPLKIYVSFRLESPTPNLDVTLMFENSLGQRILQISSSYQTDPPSGQGGGDQTFVCDIPSLPLLPGEYRISVYIDIDGINVDRVEDAMRATVVESDYYGNGKLPRHGHLALKHHWYQLGACQSGNVMGSNN